MAVIRPALSRDQLVFLEENFVVYDPLYRECYTDFSRLENCRVILMGEIHHSSLLSNIQDQFLERIIGNEPTCLLGEGLPPGETVKARERWPHAADSLTLRGADNRHQWTAAQFLAWVKLRQRIIQLEAQDQEQVGYNLRKIATRLNGYFVSQGCRGIDKAKRVVVVSKETAEACDQLLDQLAQSKTERDQEIEKLQEKLNKMHVREEKRSPEIVESNLGFVQEIIKASREYNRVIGIWGKGHFICDDELTAALNKAQLPYVILLPNKLREDEAFKERLWSHGTMPVAELKFAFQATPTTLEITECKIPKIFQSLFHPGIQTIFNQETGEPIILDTEKLVDLHKPGKILVFPAHQPIYFENIPLSDFHKLQELLKVSEGESTRITDERSIQVKNCIISVLNNILMLGHLKVDMLEFERNITCSIDCMQNKPVLELSSEGPIKLKLLQGKNMYGYASHFFREMTRLNCREFSLSPGETLFFFDLSIAQRDAIIKNPNEVIPWLNTKLPPQTGLHLKGENLTVVRGTARLIASHPDTEIQGLALQTSTGLTFEMN